MITDALQVRLGEVMDALIKQDVPERQRVSEAVKVLREEFPDMDIYPQMIRFRVSKLGQPAAAQAVGKLSRRLMTAQATATDLRRENRALIQASSELEQVYASSLESLHTLFDGSIVTLPEVDQGNWPGSLGPMTVEVLIGDLQMGKLQPGYNTEVAKARIKEHFRAAYLKIQQHLMTGYDVERILVVFLGDLIEGSQKHGVQSAMACDTSTAEQVANVQRAYLEDFLLPMSALGIDLDCVCITGNHDHDGKGSSMFKPGAVHFSWPIYQGWKHTCEALELHHVDFLIPEGDHAIIDIYGHGVLYHHGYGVKASREGLQRLRDQKAQQSRCVIDLVRMGDKHEACSFDAGKLLVNGSYFGSGSEGEEYSSIMGFSSLPAQTVVSHVPRAEGDRRHTAFDIFNIQLSHVQ